MYKKIDHNKMGRSNEGWLDSTHHFSFAGYYNPNNINFGVLRVLNDDHVEAKEGFGPHPHQNMEIVSYVIDGELSHADSMGNEHTLTRGQAQYMSAGTGVWHSELNHADKDLHFLQVWFFPDKNNYKPNYGDFRFNWNDRIDKWLHMVSSFNSANKAPIQIHSDVNVYSTYLTSGKTLDFKINEGRMVYLTLIEGEADVNGVSLSGKDAMEITDEKEINITSKENAHFFLVEVAKK
ncbi:MAG: pirin family protein [Lachnospiraceae bacterium]|jgi:redox-sensitive bicupin YhaK (pirin superfamily)|nr:pirin family protein [Lachnospiraceae bacterium]